LKVWPPQRNKFNSRKPQKTKLALVTCSAAVLLLAAVWFLLFSVRHTVTVPIGAEMPVAQAFVRGGILHASFDPMVTLPTTAKPGEFPLTVIAFSRRHNVKLRVKDNLPPTAEPQNLVGIVGFPFAAADFTVGASDDSPLTIAYTNEPNWKQSGEQTVQINLTDSWRNKTKLEAKLVLLALKPMPFELGHVPRELTAADLFAQDLPDGIPVILSTPPETKTIHSETVRLSLSGHVFEIPFSIADTTPPTAEPKPAKIFVGTQPNVRALVQNVQDASEVQVALAQSYDFSQPGTFTVTVMLRDAAGNESGVDVLVHVVTDNVPPVIIGVRDLTVTVGDTVSYRKGVEVTDNSDATIALQIDSSNVRLDKAGTYTVIYSATDPAGNRTEKTAAVTVVAEDTSGVAGLANAILNEIIAPGMSDYQKVEAVHSWAHNNIAYVSYSDKNGVADGAYNAFTKRSGDCYAYYAAVKYLLDRLGVANMTVQRQAGTHNTTHYWCFVNTGNGWYYVDACRVSGIPLPRFGLMMTQNEVEQWMAETGRDYYYIYDHNAVSIEVVQE
jgi:hypothetical protein